MIHVAVPFLRPIYKLGIDLRIRAIAAVLLLSQPAIAAPSFELVYDEVQDRACSSARGYTIKSEWIAELKESLTASRALWKSEAPAMFKAAAFITRRPTEAFAVPVTLTLCDTPSQSFSGPSVNMRFALRSFTAQAVPMRYKLDTAFHESLHPFITRVVPRNSELLANHRSEPDCVLNHLHLLALQKAVLLAVGETSALEQVVATDSLLQTSCYRRAWSIVNETADTYKQYVAEVSSGD